jgi:hypothetical protein
VAGEGGGTAIVGYDLAAPTTWGVLPAVPVDGPGGVEARHAITALAADLTTDADAAARLEQLLRAAQPGLLAQHPLAVAVWVPDPVAGFPQAHLVAELLVGDGTTADGYAASLDPTPKAGQRVLRFNTERTRLPAGDTVVVSTAGSERGGEVEEVLSFVVFPDGSTDALSLTFATNALHLVDDLAAEAWTIAESLAVTIGTPA